MITDSLAKEAGGGVGSSGGGAAAKTGKKEKKSKKGKGPATPSGPCTIRVNPIPKSAGVWPNPIDTANAVNMERELDSVFGAAIASAFPDSMVPAGVCKNQVGHSYTFRCPPRACPPMRLRTPERV
jgi:hypothetical protein